MRDIRHPLFQSATNDPPPFWIQADEAAGEWLHPDVRRESQKLWSWAYRRVAILLHDPPRAAELLEEVALEVSRRLVAEPEVGRNLKGYLIAAFRNRVTLELLRDGRITYEGLVRELEARHRLVAFDWLVPVEIKICVGEIVALMPPEPRRVVHYRLLDFTWEEIAEALGILVAQVKNKYYYGIRTASDQLMEAAKRESRKKSTA